MAKNSKSLIPYTFFMLITPVIGLFLGNFDRRLSPNAKKWLLIIFITIFGSTFNMKPSPDAVRHQESVENHYTEKTYREFFVEAYNILTFKKVEDTKNDLYLHCLGFLVGGILQMPKLLFTFVAFIYAYFYVGSAFKIIRLLKGKPWTSLAVAFFLAFVAWKTIHDLQTIRTYTGLWIMFYGALSYFQSGNKKFLALLALPPFIHLGYFVMVIPAWIVVFFHNWKMIYAVLFFVSFLTQVIPEQWALKQLQKVPIGAQKIEAYYQSPTERTQADSLEKKQDQNLRFYRAYMITGLHTWGFSICAMVLILAGGYFFYMNFIESCLLSTGILAKALSNGVFFITALSNRLEAIAAVFILAAITLFLVHQQEYMKAKKFRPKLIKLGFFLGFTLIIPVFIYKIAGFIGWASFFLIFFPFIPWLTEVNFSIRDVILHFF